MFPNTLLKAVVGFMAISIASAHIELSWPYPLRSKFDPYTPEYLIDYDMIEPLNADGSNFPCKGYNTNTPRHATVAWSAGQPYHISLVPPVTTHGIGAWNHGGGSCQLSLSYNNGRSFHVIMSIQGGCPLQYKYDFTMPKDVANGNVLFAWSWFNLEGEPQMYMNCADAIISGGSGTAATFESAYPDMFVANVNNNCSTVELQETVFAKPGKQVIYDGNVTSSSPPIPNCG